jgi:uncharacterized protein (DUF305 family)
MPGSSCGVQTTTIVCYHIFFGRPALGAFRDLFRMTPKTPNLAAAVLAIAALGACSTPRQTTQSSSKPPNPVVMRGDSAAIANAKPDKTRYQATEADINFMSGMIHHHSQAIVMAKMAPTHGANSSIQTLAGRIINAQTDEINLMSMWLRDHDQPVPTPNPKGLTMKMGGEEHVMLMPGMLTEEQMKQLEAAKGTDFDKTFLTLMIQHHSGAVSMVKELFSTYGAGLDETVFKLASDVNTDQTTEIARMQRMLFDLMVQNKPQ